MSVALKVLLIVISVLTLWYIQRKIKKSQMRIEDALFWFAVAVCLVIMSVFPQLIYKCSELLGFQAPVNFVFLVIVFLLLIKLFLLSIKVSQLESRLTSLAEEIALIEKVREAEKE